MDAKVPTLWTYQRGPADKWFGHVDWHDGKPVKREGPFESERQATVVISRMNGMEPPGC